MSLSGVVVGPHRKGGPLTAGAGAGDRLASLLVDLGEIAWVGPGLANYLRAYCRNGDVGDRDVTLDLTTGCHRPCVDWPPDRQANLVVLSNPILPSSKQGRCHGPPGQANMTLSRTSRRHPTTGGPPENIIDRDDAFQTWRRAKPSANLLRVQNEHGPRRRSRQGLPRSFPSGLDRSLVRPWCFDDPGGLARAGRQLSAPSSATQTTNSLPLAATASTIVIAAQQSRTQQQWQLKGKTSSSSQVLSPRSGVAISFNPTLFPCPLTQPPPNGERR